MIIRSFFPYKEDTIDPQAVWAVFPVVCWWLCVTDKISPTFV